MSADAKIWQEDNGDWRGICDSCPGEPFSDTEYGLSQLICDIEEVENKDHPMRWVLHIYPDGKPGLRGYCC